MCVINCSLTWHASNPRWRQQKWGGDKQPCAGGEGCRAPWLASRKLQRLGAENPRGSMGTHVNGRSSGLSASSLAPTLKAYKRTSRSVYLKMTAARGQMRTYCAAAIRSTTATTVLRSQAHTLPCTQTDTHTQANNKHAQKPELFP